MSQQSLKLSEQQSSSRKAVLAWLSGTPLSAAAPNTSSSASEELSASIASATSDILGENDSPGIMSANDVLQLSMVSAMTRPSPALPDVVKSCPSIAESSQTPDSLPAETEQTETEVTTATEGGLMMPSSTQNSVLGGINERPRRTIKVPARSEIHFLLAEYE